VSQRSLFDPDRRGTALAWIDGGARGNPGPAGYGARIERDGVVHELKGFLGTATNNVAEYHGLIAALEWAAGAGVAAMHVRSDSMLVVKQMLGAWKVKHDGLKPLHTRARGLAREIGSVTYEHVLREQNTEADRLANEAMDEAGG
jgi:ribonuclease HI